MDTASDSGGEDDDTVPGDEVRESVWDYSIPVPGCRLEKRIWPKAEVDLEPWTREQLRGRFFYVKDQLEALVHKHLRLCGFGQQPVYASRMVGVSPDEARPAVVVFCRDIDLRKIRKLFRNHASQPLNLFDESITSQLGFSSFRRDPPSNSLSSSRPPFHLIYIPTATPTFVRTALDKPISVTPSRDGTSCGSLVHFDGATATLGVAIDLPWTIAFLTVQHVFGDDDAKVSMSADSESPLEDEQRALPQYDSHSDKDDDEHEGLKTDRSGAGKSVSCGPDLGNSHLGWQASTRGQATIEPGSASQEWERVSLSQMVSSTAPFLDWALVNRKIHHLNFPLSLTPSC